jgi:hypothetical protein
MLEKKGWMMAQSVKDYLKLKGYGLRTLWMDFFSYCLDGHWTEGNNMKLLG